MEPPITPFNEISNPKENLIYPEEHEEQDNKAIYNVNQVFAENENNKSPENEKFIITFNYYRLIVIIIAIVTLIAIIALAIPGTELKIEFRIILIILGVIFNLILLIFFNNKLEVIKNKPNNRAIIKLKNYFCCNKKTIKIDLENIYFFCVHKAYTDSEGNERESTRLFIINNYKNLLGIDLDNSDIKSKAAKIFYSFNKIGEGKYGYKKLNEDLNNFVEASGDNPLTFNIKNYMIKTKDTNESFFSNKLSNYMKFSDNFFVYHLINPFNTTCIDKTFKVIIFVSNYIFISLGIGLILRNIENIAIIIICSLLFVIPNIIIYSVYKCVLAKKNIFRIDIIYSTDFDRIFIGLVKYNKESYVNTFEFQMNNINKFILDNNYILTVIFKNNDSQIICNINKSQEELEGLLFLLNERLNSNTNDNNGINTNDCDNNQI